MLLLKTPELATGRVTLKARRVGGNEGFLLFFNASNIDRFLFCNFGAAGNSFHAIQDRGSPEGTAFRGGQHTQGKIDNERWYDITLTVARDRAEVALDGKKVSDASVQYLPSFFATAGYERDEKSIVVKATNYRNEPVRAELSLQGVNRVGARGKHIVISSQKPSDENTLESPRSIVPREQPLTNCTSRFSVTLAPYSVNLLKIPAR
jgi:alpha-L-arabinofuranosidase